MVLFYRPAGGRRGCGGEAWGHSVGELLKGLCEKVKVPVDLIHSAKQLDKFYISARYPNGWVSGTHSDYISNGTDLHFPNKDMVLASNYL